jgi:hypothetical protein
MFQKPWEAPEVAILLRGRQGVGKSIFVESLGEILGDYFLAIAHPKHLVGSFNAHLPDKLLVLADEAFFGKERTYTGILKTLVTQTTMAVEPKGVNVFSAKKYFRLFMASNEGFMLPVDIDDRRYLILDVDPVHQKDHEYFRALREEWANGGREAFYFQMLSRDISNFNHRRRPETPALDEHKLLSLTGAQRLVYELLEAGQGWSIVKLERDYAAFISTDHLRSGSQARDFHVSDRALALELGKIALSGMSKRIAVEGRQIRGFWLPELKQARKRWTDANGLKVSWLDPEAVWILEDPFNRGPYIVG